MGESNGSRRITRYLEIPKVFHSVLKGGPFTNCIECGADLLGSNHFYAIEKVFRGSEVIIEMAMCLDCRTGQCQDGMSEQSANALHGFLGEKVDYQRRLELMATVNDSDSIDPWLERCLLSDKPTGMFRDYQIVALCRGPWIQRDFYPTLISGPAMEEVTDLLSSETRDWMDDFVGSNFGMPSEFCSPPMSPILL